MRYTIARRNTQRPSAPRSSLALAARARPCGTDNGAAVGMVYLRCGGPNHFRRRIMAVLAAACGVDRSLRCLHLAPELIGLQRVIMRFLALVQLHKSVISLFCKLQGLVHNSTLGESLGR